METEERMAPTGYLWVCGACGKTSPDRYGGKDATRGWDVSCAMNATLYPESRLVRSDETGRVISIDLSGAPNG